MTKLFLKGVRCFTEKCPIDKGHPIPGQHGGARRPRKMSDYGSQLREKQKLRRTYGLQEGQFRLVYQNAIRAKGVTGTIMLQRLEMRLDNVLYRMGFATSRACARQFVRHNHVELNGHKANIPSMLVKPGDVVAVRDRERSKSIAAAAFASVSNRQLPEWIEVDPKNFRGQIVSVPTREQIAPAVDEQLVVELYSR
jgi:small subunit ribosomal protein S4